MKNGVLTAKHVVIRNGKIHLNIIGVVPNSHGTVKLGMADAAAMVIDLCGHIASSI